MAKIVWSSKALFDKKEVLEFWISKNKSNVYSKKLNLLIEQKTETNFRKSRLRNSNKH